MGPSVFTSHPKEVVLRIFIAIKNPSPRPGSNPRPLDLVASILTTEPPRLHSINELFSRHSAQQTRLEHTQQQKVKQGLNLNSVKQLIFVMVKCGVLFEVRTEFLNNI
jgi:hypothetical protein